MNVSQLMEQALGSFGLAAEAGLPPETAGAVQVVALCRHRVDGVLVYAGQTYWMLRERAEANAKRDILHIPDATRLDWWGAAGRVLSPFAGDTNAPLVREATPGALRIAQGCGYDPGAAAYRFHSAVNQCTKHASAFSRFGDTNPHSSLRQFDGVANAPVVRESLITADVLHCHMNYMLAANTTSSLLRDGDVRSAKAVQWRPGQWIVRHYHGSRPDGRTNLEHRVDDLVRRRAEIDGGGLIRVGARLTLCAEEGAGDLEWLPIAVPVARYRALRTEVGYTPYDGGRVFRIAHSPTKRSYKGTDKLFVAAGRLRAKGLRVDVVLIEGLSHAEALRRKATCDATFDSFWLGIQGSGLEAGAIGQPVIAGDGDVRQLYLRDVGYCPYTFAANEVELERVLERLIVDEAYRAAEAERVAGYVEQVHDYAPVARRYEAMLARHMNRPDAITTPAPAPTPALTPALTVTKTAEPFVIPPSVVDDDLAAAASVSTGAPNDVRSEPTRSRKPRGRR